MGLAAHITCSELGLVNPSGWGNYGAATMNERILRLFFPVLLLTCVVSANAASPTQGNNEFTGRFSYSDISFGSYDQKETELTIAYGRYLTDMHEIGFSASYTDLEADVDGFSESVDGSSLGVFYNLNFPTSGSILPFIGVGVATIGGDLGDAYDWGYDISAGLKIYPFQHAGFVFQVSYTELMAAEDFIEDADGIVVGAGLIIRF